MAAISYTTTSMGQGRPAIAGLKSFDYDFGITMVTEQLLNTW
jgi:hypothetical protein